MSNYPFEFRTCEWCKKPIGKGHVVVVDHPFRMMVFYHQECRKDQQWTIEGVIA